MSWYIGQEVIWVGRNGNEVSGQVPAKITGIRSLGCCDLIMLETTCPKATYLDGTPQCYCGRGVQSFGIMGKYRDSNCYRPLISDSCIAELTKEQVLTAQ